MQIEMDFIDDIIVGLTAELNQLGYKAPAPAASKLESAHKLGVQHWNAYTRRIPARVRTAHRSAELLETERSLPDSIRRGLAVVVREIEAGTDLTPRLSRKLPKLGHRDKMLNDWGFHHLHLDDTDRSGGTNEVLILLAHLNDAYLIDVREHEHWSDQDLVEIVHTNWPTALAQHRQVKVLGLTHAVSNDGRAALRGKGCNAPIETADGTVYMLMGGGFTQSGDNIRAVRWSHWLLGHAQLVEEFFKGQRQWLEEMIEGQLGCRPDRIRVHLKTLRRDQAQLCFEHGRKLYIFEQPIDVPPRTIVDFTGDTLEQ